MVTKPLAPLNFPEPPTIGIMIEKTSIVSWPFVDAALELSHAAANSAATSGTGRRIAPMPIRPDRYSHSIVAGGFDVTSRTTRFTPGISLTIREATSSTRS